MQGGIVGCARIRVRLGLLGVITVRLTHLIMLQAGIRVIHIYITSVRLTHT